MIRTHQSSSFALTFFLTLLTISPIILSGCDESLFKEKTTTPKETKPEERIPVITIKKLSSEKINTPPTSGEKITWNLQADIAPLVDTIIIVSIPTGNNQSIDQWIMIPKFKPTSERFTNTIYEGAIEVLPLPMTVIAGEGETVNNTKLRQNMPDETRTGVKVPSNFEFPMYTVGNPSQILCDDCNAPTHEPPPTNEPLPKPTSTNQPTTKPTTKPLPEPIEKPVQPIQTTQPTQPADITPPTLISSSIKNGSVKINYAIINQTGKLEFEFNEPITGQGKITDVFGTNLQWRASTRINTLTLNKGAGGNLVAGLTYTIELNVQDAFHNSSLITIVFVTRIKE